MYQSVLDVYEGRGNLNQISFIFYLVFVLLEHIYLVRKPINQHLCRASGDPQVNEFVS
jgi:hypothetical protein